MAGDVFNIEVVTTGDVEVLALRGELDVANAERVRTRLLSSEASILVVDLEGLTFIDSSGLTALVHAHNQLTGRGRGFELRGATKGVKRVFEITGLTDFLTET